MDASDCCQALIVIKGQGYVCTVPKTVNHAEHESWTAFGCWSGDPDCGGTLFGQHMNKMWPNDKYKLPGPTKIDYSDWADDFDNLPDA